MFLMLNQSERFLVDAIIEATRFEDDNNVNTIDLLFDIAENHLKFLDNHSSWSKDNDVRKMIVNFALLGRRLRSRGIKNHARKKHTMSDLKFTLCWVK